MTGMTATTTTSDKVRENRLRRAAERRGMVLIKSRRRDPQATDFGRFALLEENLYFVLGGNGIGQFTSYEAMKNEGIYTATLDDVERFLNRKAVS